MRTLQIIFPVSLICLLMSLGLWVYSSFGVGYIEYSSQQNEKTHEIDDNWMILAGSGSFGLMRRQPLRYPEFGFDYVFTEYDKNSLKSDMNWSDILLGDFKYKDDFGIIPIRWALSIPFWLLTLISAIAVTITSRIYISKMISFKSKTNPNQPNKNS